MKKSIKEMSHAEFTTFSNHGKKKGLSDFAQFHQDLHGYDIFLKGTQVAKWEIFSRRITAEKILSDQTKYTFKKRVSKIVLPN